MLAVPTSLVVKPGDRIILMSESDGGKTSFFHALMGNLSLVSGRISYGGKIGYLPQKLWFRKTTVRENILFGMEYNQRKLGQIYRTVLLKDELPLLSHGDLTQMKDLSHLT
jgi:ATP-binding cassette subfamily C (CFTR/MRP) protein 1